MSSPSKLQVKHTIGDLLKSHPKFFLTYHVLDAGYDILTPLGVVIGGAAYYGLGFKPFDTPLATMGTAGLVGGSTGMLLGTLRLIKTAATADNWNETGIEKRVDGLSHNFKIRVLENSVWGGLGLAAAALYVAGGPQKVGFSPGALGVAQGLSLGSAVGSVAGMACIASTKNRA